MSLKARISKIEKVSNPEELNIILIKPPSDKPLSEPVRAGAVKISYRYEVKND